MVCHCTILVLLLLWSTLYATNRHLLQQNFEEICGVEENANFKGDFLLGGELNLLDSLEDCCRSCQEQAKCNVFVYCGVQTGCQNEGEILSYKRCDLKFQQIVEDGGEPEFWFKGPGTDFTSGAFLKSSVLPLPPPATNGISPPEANVSVSSPPLPGSTIDPIVTNTANQSPSPEPLTVDPQIVNPNTVTSSPTTYAIGVSPFDPIGNAPSSPGVTTIINPDLLQFGNGTVPVAEQPAPVVEGQDPFVINNN
eukprot:TRINITY_DN334_c0_g1_i22.p2 TRINITY_DN334_c0_g1~~TRINITY_DN334_c0_g1_i22.p2  ORF type:complete len:252 (-),score=38.80 TRINITY_DN334_c0_g1_i22:339-1094(-)